MGERKSRLGTTAALKARKADDNILLARGLSARLTGANTPLTALTQEEMERDLRHMEAFSNACTTYAQQYYIFHCAKDGNNTNDGGDGSLSNKHGRTPHPAPLIAMPVRIDPEEEKRLQNLRQKIQQCEAQREVYEGQYLSLRAHYIYLSQQLKGKRDDVNKRISFLQEQVNKRGRLVALQRVRLQILRDTLQCVQYREKFRVKQEGDPGELYTVWGEIEKEWKKAEDDLRSPSGIMNWTASKVPKIPPGVPLLLSQLAEQPGQAAAWGTGGAFGAKPDSLLWIENQVPTAPPDTAEDLPALREEVAKLNDEIEREQALNKQIQSDVISIRKRDDGLVAMMALLRTETEAVIARHNILLESDVAQQTALRLHEEESRVANEVNDTIKEVDAVGSRMTGGKAATESLDAADPNISLPESSGLKDEDEENDGDDEGGAEEEEDDGEVLEGDAAGKRPFDAGEIESPRSKRRKL
jgi:hypothetical protein